MAHVLAFSIHGFYPFCFPYKLPLVSHSNQWHPQTTDILQYILLYSEHITSTYCWTNEYDNLTRLMNLDVLLPSKPYGHTKYVYILSLRSIFCKYSSYNIFSVVCFVCHQKKKYFHKKSETECQSDQKNDDAETKWKMPMNFFALSLLPLYIFHNLFYTVVRRYVVSREGVGMNKAGGQGSYNTWNTGQIISRTEKCCMSWLCGYQWPIDIIYRNIEEYPGKTLGIVMDCYHSTEKAEKFLIYWGAIFFFYEETVFGGL